MKFGPLTKLDKTNKKTQKTFDDDVMTTNCDAIVIFPIYYQFGANRKQDSGGTVFKIYISIKSYL